MLCGDGGALASGPNQYVASLDACNQKCLSEVGCVWFMYEVPTKLCIPRIDGCELTQKSTTFIYHSYRPSGWKSKIWISTFRTKSTPIIQNIDFNM